MIILGHWVFFVPRRNEVAEGGYCISLRLSFRPYGLNNVKTSYIVACILVPHLNEHDGGHLELRVRIFFNFRLPAYSCIEEK